MKPENQLIIKQHQKLNAQCGKNTEFVAYVTDMLFRDIFKTDENYKIIFYFNKYGNPDVV